MSLRGPISFEFSTNNVNILFPIQTASGMMSVFWHIHLKNGFVIRIGPFFIEFCCFDRIENNHCVDFLKTLNVFIFIELYSLWQPSCGEIEILLE
jgi:hypothetical protein